MRFASWPNRWILVLYVMPVFFVVALIVLPDRKLHVSSRPMWTHDLLMSLSGLWALLLAAIVVVRIGLAANGSASQPRPQGFEPVMPTNDENETSDD